MTRAKHWNPPKWPSLLTREEDARLRKIEKRLAGPGRISLESARWLSQRVRTLASVTHFDFDFPKHMAVVDSPQAQSVRVWFVERVAKSWALTLKGVGFGSASEWEVFQGTLPCRANEATLFVRPYLLLAKPRSTAALHVLQQLEAVVEFDGEKIHCPVLDWVIGLDGKGVTRRPFSFGGQMSNSMLRGQNINSLLGDVEPDLGDEIGAVLAAKTNLRIALRTPHPIEQSIEIAIGCVMGRYTTSPL